MVRLDNIGLKEGEELVGTAVCLLGAGGSGGKGGDRRFRSVVGGELRGEVGREGRCLGRGRETEWLHNTNMRILGLVLR
jgi:hypothetical protein